MESEDEEQHIHLACKHDIYRSKEEEEYAVGQEQQTEHLAGVVVFPAIEQAIDPADADIADEGAQESYEQQDQRKHRVDGSAYLRAEGGGEHASHEREDDEQQCCDYASDDDADKHFTHQLPSAEIARLVEDVCL